MALSCALRLPCWHLRPSSALLSSLPGQDRSLLTEKKTAATWKEKKKAREGCSLPGSSWEERLANAVTPLWRLPYQEQLQVKCESQRKILQTLASRLEELGIDAQKPGGLCCPLWPVVPSPIINGYRNKSTFSVNRGPDGNPKTVGLYVGTGRGAQMGRDHLGRVAVTLTGAAPAGGRKQKPPALLHSVVSHPAWLPAPPAALPEERRPGYRTAAELPGHRAVVHAQRAVV